MATEKEILNEAQDKFMQLDNVVDVRLGYKFKDGWITNQRAIVIKVAEKKSENKLRSECIEILPKEFESYPLDIIEPTIFDYLPALELAEISLKAKKDSKITPKYFPPNNLPLAKITEKIKLIAHVSPERGWENLKTHITTAVTSNTIGMYDFGAKHIGDSIIETGRKQSFKSLTLAIQKGESLSSDTKKDDLKDSEMIEEIKKALKGKFNTTYIKTGTTNGWVPYSYHIKVSVTDSKRFWLSSGNWQSSNQPNSNIIENSSHENLLQEYNREWNLIIENEYLSALFEKYIFHDYENNTKVPGKKYFELAQDIFFAIPVEKIGEPLRKGLKVKPISDLVLERDITLTPLLSPDNYFNEVKKLLQSSENEILIQNQTLQQPYHPEYGTERPFIKELLSILLEKQNSGVDIKIIFRRDVGDPRRVLEDLKDFGLDTDNIMLQDNCHTKGIIVDASKVVVGSHNWSDMGVSLNRDASILFEDDEIASYFKEAFLHDWENFAQQKIRTRALSDVKATQFMQVSLREIQELL